MRIAKAIRCLPDPRNGVDPVGSESGLRGGLVVGGTTRASERVVVEQQRRPRDRRLDPDLVVVRAAIDDRRDLGQRRLVVLVAAQLVQALAEAAAVVGLGAVEFVLL